MTAIPDLAPGLPSRIVTGRSTVITERGPVKDGRITFSLTQAILSVSDKTYLEASSVEVPMDTSLDGRWEVRLPTVSANVEPADSWSITVKYSTRPYPFEIRVPAGTDPIDLADIGEVHGVAPEHAGWVVTGMQIGTVTKGSTAAARISGQAPTLTLDLTLPQGDKGDKGDTGAKGSTGATGPANTLTVGTVTTGEPGSSAKVTVTGTSPAQVLNLVIPRGDTGKGLSILGTKATSGDLPAKGTLGDGWLIGDDLWVWNGTAWQNVGVIKGPKGDTGDRGAAGLNGGTITSVTQASATTMAVKWTAPDGTTTTSTLTLPSGQTGFTEAEPAVWTPTAVPTGTPTPALLGVDRTNRTLPQVVDTMLAHQEWTRIPRIFGERYRDRWITGMAIVSAGTSTAAGTGATTDDRKVIQRLAALITPTAVVSSFPPPAGSATPATGVTVYEVAQGGTTTASYLSDATVTAIGQIKPVLMMHAVLGNDYFEQRPAADVEASIRGWLAKLDAVTPGTLHLFWTHQPRNDRGKTPSLPFKTYTQVVDKIVAENPQRLAFLDLSRRFDKLGIPGDNTWGLVGPDNMHLTDLGHKLLADWLAEYLGIPTPPAAGELVIATNTAGGDVAAGTVCLSAAIPARPWPRVGTITATVFCNARDGATVDLEMGAGPDGMRARITGTQQSHTMTLPVMIPAGAAYTAVVRAAGPAYVSASPIYSKMSGLVVPA